MLPATNRLTDSDAFRRTVRSGDRAGSTRLVIHLLVDEQVHPGAAQTPTAQSPAAQIGFTVSKAVGNAVVRNRVKRRLRHLTRRHLPTLEELPGRVTLVVRALAPAAGARHEQLAADLDRCLERALSSRVPA